MSRYTTWPLVTGRYPLAASRGAGGADSAVNHFIVGAEDELDGYAGQSYTVPFTPVPGFIVDLATDLAYLKMNHSDEWLAKSVSDRLTMLSKGKVTLVVSGDALLSGNAAWVENAYRSKFGPDDPVNWSVGSEQLQDAADART